MKPEETDPKPPEEPAIVQEIRKLVAFDSDDTPGDQCIRCRCGISVQPGDEPTALCHDCAHWVFDHLGVTLSHLDRLASAWAGEREPKALSCGQCGALWMPASAIDELSDLVAPYRQRAKTAEQERDSLRSDLATAKRGLEAWKSTAAKKNDQLIELESARSQPSVSAGERASDEELRRIADAAYASQSGGFPSENMRRALFDAGVARGEAKRVEALGRLRQLAILLSHERCAGWLDVLGKAIESLQPAAPKGEPREKKPPEKCGSCGGTRFVARDERGEYRGPAMIGEDGELCPDCTGEKTMAGLTGSQKDRDTRNVAASEAGHPIERLTLPELLPSGAKLRSGASVGGWVLYDQISRRYHDGMGVNSVGAADIDWSTVSVERLTREELVQIRQKFYLGAVTPPAYRMLTVDSFAWAKLLDAASRDLALSEQEKKPQLGGEPVVVRNLRVFADHEELAACGISLAVDRASAKEFLRWLDIGK